MNSVAVTGLLKTLDSTFPSYHKGKRLLRLIEELTSGTEGTEKENHSVLS